MSNIKHFFKFLAFQLLQLVVIIICTSLTMYLIPILPLYLYILFTVTESVNRKVYRKYTCIKAKDFWLTCFLPIFLIYAAIETVFAVLLACYGFNVFYISIIVILAINFVMFFISAAMSLQRCSCCGVSGIGILELDSVDIIKEWESVEDNGTVDDYQTIKVTDYDGNSYTGEVKVGSHATYKITKYQIRRATYRCKLCGYIEYKEKEIKYNIFRKFKDLFIKE